VLQRTTRKLKRDCIHKSILDLNRRLLILIKNGKKFYWLTRYLELSYMWYDKERKVIELWGPYESLQNFQAHHILECELDLSCNKILVN